MKGGHPKIQILTDATPLSEAVCLLSDIIKVVGVGVVDQGGPGHVIARSS